MRKLRKDLINILDSRNSRWRKYKRINRGERKIEEIWKGVTYQGINYAWRFECSNLGRIRNALTKHVYIPHKGGIGYLQICTSINGKRKNIKVHKAVAETFINNPNNFPVINHIDGNKENNIVDNLEWCTYQDNSVHAWNMGLMENCKNNSEYLARDFYGEQNGMSKLTENDVRYIRKNYISKGKGKKCNRAELAEMFNVTPALISKIYKREIWKHVK